MTHAQWQLLRDVSDAAGDAMHNAHRDLEDWLEGKGWERIIEPGCHHKWIEPKEGGAFGFEAAVLLQEEKDREEERKLSVKHLE